ncbi:unnamed protein product [Clonostachys rosea]|uniref:Enoyl-CoA hydratase n=1 Tax=Bionectria ochroleuca TaxID=29856 RepID=A0ABY6UET1_BIOOC|nr:unnamed protein product [Clonostachys rosea]
MSITQLCLLSFGLLLQDLPIQAKYTNASTSQYGTITHSQKGAVLNVLFDNNSTEINIYDNKIQSDLYDLVTQLQNDTTVKVLVFRSANPDFFLAHGELTAREGTPNFALDDPRNEVANAWRLFYNVTELPMASIAVVDGRARGAGNEFAMSCDMRFATKRSMFGQPEVGLGFNPGAGATQYLPRLIGRGRALEYLLTGLDVTGEEAERLGWINRAFGEANEMEDFVGDLARRIALFPNLAIANVKALVNTATRPPLEDLAQEGLRYLGAASTEEAQGLINKTLKLTDDESRRWFELDVGKHLPNLYK